MASRIKITLVKSPIGRSQSQRKTLTGMGLRKMQQTVELEDTPAIRGMVEKVKFMLRVEES